MEEMTLSNLAELEILAQERCADDKDEYCFDFKNSLELIRGAIEAGEAVTIIGDYDCDGICASAILLLALRAVSAAVKVKIPLRFSQGYGICREMIDAVDAGLIITVDNGITAMEEVAAAKEKGLKFLLTDHHLPGESAELPEADCILDPHVEAQLGLEGYDYTGYCGAGIALKLAEALLEGRDELLLDKLYALAALATVADSVDLKGDNRRICRRGMRAMAEGRVTTGLRLLLEQFGYFCRDRIGSVAPWMQVSGDLLGFYLAPCVNAPSRLVSEEDRSTYPFVLESGGDGAKISLMCLISEREEQAQYYLNAMVDYNNTRRNLSAKWARQADKVIRECGMENDSPIVLAMDEMEQGLAGLLANRLCRDYGVPAAVMTQNPDGMYVGSMRSPEGLHARRAMDAAGDLLERYGGHAGAAGFTLEPSRLEEFRQRLSSFCGGFREKKTEEAQYDLEIPFSEVSAAMRLLEEKIAPFGQGNPEPVFLIRDIPVQRAQVLKDKHVKISAGEELTVLGFSLAQDGKLPPEVGTTVSAVGRLGYNCFRGKASPQLTAERFIGSAAGDYLSR